MSLSYSKCALLALMLMFTDNIAAAFENSIGMTLVRIPAGKFTMGSPAGEKDRLDHENQHEVEITRDLYLGTHEVTIGQFRKFATDEGYRTDAETDGQGGFGYNEATGSFEGRKPQYTWQNTGWNVTDDHPVVNVSWNDAKAFCAWLSRKEQKTWRLPTEAEWEYACRAGSKTAFQNGDDPEGLAQAGNVADGTAKAKLPNLKAILAKDGYVFTAPVGKFQKNRFGLYDMHGNVWEWCEDWYDPGRYPEGSPRDPTGPSTGSSRAFRGGSWDRTAARCRSAARGGNAPTFRNFILGFRVVSVP